jgi:hypothetical protein
MKPEVKKMSRVLLRKIGIDVYVTLEWLHYTEILIPQWEGCL